MTSQETQPPDWWEAAKVRGNTNTMSLDSRHLAWVEKGTVHVLCLGIYNASEYTLYTM
jgi:hypothetical protein